MSCLKSGTVSDSSSESGTVSDVTSSEGHAEGNFVEWNIVLILAIKIKIVEIFF